MYNLSVSLSLDKVGTQCTVKLRFWKSREAHEGLCDVLMVWLYSHTDLLKSWCLFGYFLGSFEMSCFWVDCTLKCFLLLIFLIENAYFMEELVKRESQMFDERVRVLIIQSFPLCPSSSCTSEAWYAGPSEKHLWDWPKAALQAQHIVSTETSCTTDKVGKSFTFKFYHLGFHLLKIRIHRGYIRCSPGRH